MNVSIKDVLATYTDEKRESEREEAWVYYVIRPLSWYPSLWFINGNISANKVTVLSIVFVFAASILIFFGNLTAALVGSLCLFLWGVLDCSDGTVARFKKKTNEQGHYLGEFLDAAGAYAVYAAIIPALGVYSLNGNTGIYGLSVNHIITDLIRKSLGINEANITILFLSLAWWTAVASMTSRLLFQKYKTLKGGEFLEIKRSKSSLGLKKLLVALSQNIISATNFFLPLLIIALLTGGSLWYIFIYALLNSAMLFFTVIKIVKDLM